MNQKDYYKILGVSEKAGQAEIKKAYRNLAFLHHPDRSTGNEEMMKEINEAYAVLSNPVKRNEYDSLRQRYGSFARDQFRQTHSDQDIFRDSDIGQIFEELSRAFGFSRPEDIFSRNNFYGPHYRTFEFKVYGGPGLGSLFLGGMASLIQNLVAKKLGLDLPKNGRDLYDVISITPEEAAAGGKVTYRYQKQGSTRELLVTLPGGIRDGQKIKLKGLGEKGRNGGKDGDLYLKAGIRKSFLGMIKSLLKK